MSSICIWRSRDQISLPRRNHSVVKGKQVRDWLFIALNERDGSGLGSHNQRGLYCRTTGKYPVDNPLASTAISGFRTDSLVLCLYSPRRLCKSTHPFGYFS